MKKLIYCFALSFLSLHLSAQADKTTSYPIPLLQIQMVESYLDGQVDEWNLTPADIDALRVTDFYQTKSTGVSHLYFTQTYRGIPIAGAMVNLAIDNQDKIYQAGHRLIGSLSEKVNTTIPQLDPADALTRALEHLELPTQSLPRMTENDSDQLWVFDGGTISEEPIKVALQYFVNKENNLVLSWQLAIRRLDNSDFPSLYIDAVTGAVLNEHNYTHYCRFPGAHPYGRLTDHDIAGFCKHEAIPSSIIKKENTVSTGSYRVFPLPVESPAHGNRALVSDPDDSMGSPFGWHDNNGSPGAEFTITRGNNVHAYQDGNGNNLPANDEPNGGAALNFDYNYNVNNTPAQNQNAAVTNLFYAANYIHDVAYRYGFDEPAGNFQQNNYGNGGFQNDYVQAEALDGDAVNNAQWSAGPEGSRGRLEMFLWNREAGGQRVVNVTSPPIAAGLYNAGLANYGNSITNTPVSGEVVIVDDGVNNPLSTDGCESNFVNGDALNGKIALVDRGGCDFELKTAYAESFGAIAVIICDFNPEPAPVLGVPSVPNPTIPTVRIGSVDCQKIRVHAGSGLQISLVLPPATGPEFLNGSFDNGTIIHEYTHGISNRLTGGPNTNLCLNNNEQMGEGWSDFFALTLTARTGDTGPMPRGIATYLQREPNDGKGIRNFPYSTDLTINPYTYKDIGNERIPHGLGAVWCAMLWDLHWDMVEAYGFSSDFYNGNSGNNRTLQLVMDGLKMQPCDPGFVDARNAILQADQIRYGGANQRLIWETFARRGLGFSADQGSNNGVDAFEAYDLPPLLVEELKISKRSSPLIDAGDVFNIFLEVYNHKNETLNDVMVTDELPDGLTFTGVTNVQATQNGNVLEFSLGDMAYRDSISIIYQVRSADNLFSVRKAFYPTDDLSDFDIVPVQPNDVPELWWTLSGEDSHTGNFSWYINNTAAESRQHLVLRNAAQVTGTRPALRFYHNYKTEPGIDGGIVEVTTDANPDGARFDLLNDKMIRNGYPGFIQYTTFIIPNLEAFTGTSDDWIASYVDLSDYQNESIFVRFNFATSNGGVPPGGGFWFVDDIELMDLFSYNGTACARATQGEEACTEIPEGGIIVESKLAVGTEDLEPAGWNFQVFPNPASEALTVAVSLELSTELQLSLYAVSGQLVKTMRTIQEAGRVQTRLDLTEIPKGFYFLEVITSAGKGVRRIVVE